MSDTGGSAGQRFLAKFFELRMIIAVLFTIYGLVCIVWGIGFTSQAELQKAAGINVNLLAGIGMLVLGLAFGAWALLSPIQAEAPAEARSERAEDTAG
ncbi:hypothetical protein [uncultured Amnibacterium sp.]|uniref:hypothetical protein n=1 Tax=uncultured Amnibacterium sp. TaxID=1631851 RepID=UPI0035CBABFB